MPPACSRTSAPLRALPRTRCPPHRFVPLLPAVPAWTRPSLPIGSKCILMKKLLFRLQFFVKNMP